MDECQPFSAGMAHGTETQWVTSVVCFYFEELACRNGRQGSRERISLELRCAASGRASVLNSRTAASCLTHSLCVVFISSLLAPWWQEGLSCCSGRECGVVNTVFTPGDRDRSVSCPTPRTRSKISAPLTTCVSLDLP